MEKLQDKINDLQDQVDNLYNIVIALQLDNLKLISKFKDLEDFWYEK